MRLKAHVGVEHRSDDPYHKEEAHETAHSLTVQSRRPPTNRSQEQGYTAQIEPPDSRQQLAPLQRYKHETYVECMRVEQQQGLCGWVRCNKVLHVSNVTPVFIDSSSEIESVTVNADRPLQCLNY